VELVIGYTPGNGHCGCDEAGCQMGVTDGSYQAMLKANGVECRMDEKWDHKGTDADTTTSVV